MSSDFSKPSELPLFLKDTQGRETRIKNEFSVSMLLTIQYSNQHRNTEHHFIRSRLEVSITTDSISIFLTFSILFLFEKPIQYNREEKISLSQFL